MKTRRSGFSLLQLLIVLTVTSLLLGLAIAWMNRAFDFAAEVRTQKRLNQQLLRLSASLREDVQHSRSVKVVGQRLTLQLDGDREVSYALKNDSIQKESFREGERLARDRFALAPDSIARWEAGQLPGKVGLVVFKNRVRGVHAGQSSRNDKAKDRAAIDFDESQLIVEFYMVVQANRWPENWHVELPEKASRP